MLQIKHFIYTISPMVWVKFNNPIIRERLVVKSPLFRVDIPIAATGYSHSMLQQIRTAVFISSVIKLNFIPSFLPYHNYDIFIRCKCSVISQEDSKYMLTIAVLVMNFLITMSISILDQIFHLCILL